MTGACTALRPMSPAVARAVRYAAAACTLVLVGTVAFAQGWEPTVSVGPGPPKSPGPPLVKAAAPKARPATAPDAIAAETEAVELTARKAFPTKVTSSVPIALETGSVKETRADDYCANIGNPAADARLAWQKKILGDMEQEIAKRVAVLEEKTAEYQKWLARRDEFSRKANETVLRIYARMRPDAAAVQLAKLDEETAASVLTKLEPRVASLILNEMDPAQAVRLTATISGAGKVATAPMPKNVPEAKTK